MQLTSRLTEPQPVCLKRTCSPKYQAHQGRAELQVARCVDSLGCPQVLLLSEGRMSDHNGAAQILDALPRATVMLGDRGYDADWFRAALTPRHRALHPAQSQTQGMDRLRQEALPPATQDREHVGRLRD